jgi:hypothetical protein
MMIASVGGQIAKHDQLYRAKVEIHSVQLVRDEQTVQLLGHSIHWPTYGKYCEGHYSIHSPLSNNEALDPLKQERHSVGTVLQVLHSELQLTHD